MRWATDISESSTRIFWLKGLAGAGKSTIAYSFCEDLQARNIPVASFFCSRGTNCAKAGLIIPTIAYQLARSGWVSSESLRLVLRDLDAGTKLPREQCRLWLSPLLSAISKTLTISMIIVIDALDECDDQQLVQSLLFSLAGLQSSLQVKFLLTSRPEHDLRIAFSNLKPSPRQRDLFDIADESVKGDIKRFVQSSLHSVEQDRRNTEGARTGWPPSHEVEALVEQSGKLFIYASTACLYIAQSRNISDCLTEVVNFKTRSGKHLGTSELYTYILKKAVEAVGESPSAEDRLCSALSSLVSSIVPLSARILAALLNTEPPTVIYSLADLHSVIRVPAPTEPDGLVTIFHASFPDFLTSDRVRIFIELDKILL